LDRNFDDHHVSYAKGDEIGLFKLGSTVVLIYEVRKLYLFRYRLENTARCRNYMFRVKIKRIWKMS